MFPHLTKIENKTVKTYGIIAFDKPLYGKIVKDISTDKESINHLVNDLNSCKVELIHLDDVIEDFLCK